LVVVAGLEREKKFTIYNLQFTIYNLQFTIFGFWFSIPKIPELCGRSREKKKVFLAYFPYHPSKLYSSLGWLNSKVPKPFPPFSLRLIDVDGF
jgi:hypothetical protein